MLPTEKSYVDIYQSLYGMFDLKKKAKVDNAKRKLQILSGRSSQIGYRLSWTGQT
jgi:hypothetical protein